MATPYFDYFDNLFENLRMSRPAYKKQAQYTYTAVQAQELGAAFVPLLQNLQKALASFDENLADRSQSTAGTTSTYQAARRAWLTFVDDAMKDYVTPQLRKLPVYADFKNYGKSRLAALAQSALLVQSEALLQLYRTYQAALKAPTLADDATKLLQAVRNADDQQDAQQSTLADARLGLADDRAAIARAQRRLKAQLELTFDDSEKVYSFFDFSQATVNKSGKVKKPATPTS